MRASPFSALRSLPAALVALAALAAAPACGDNTGDAQGPGGGADACANAPKVTKNDHCAGCTHASPTCRAPRIADACCTWVAPPTTPLARGVGLQRNSSADPTIDLGCLDAPGELGTPKTITLTGHVRLFSSGGDSAGVKIEIFKENEDGSLGDPVGSPVLTTDDDATARKETWLEKCPDGGCTLRAYTYPGVPTETRLIVKTSDGGGGAQWAALYDYNMVFRNANVTAEDTLVYDPAVVAATDINTVASAAGGFSPNHDKGMLAGEIHDCGDVRLSGATVDIDASHEGDIFYFGENESNPLPDKGRTSEGTSKLGLFGTLNIPTGVPVRISALGLHEGETVLLGTHIIQTFPGSVTSLSLRGRRPWQR